MGANDGFAPSDSGRTSLISSSYNLAFSGSQQIQTVTMLAHAKYGELNYSNNPTFITSSNPFQIPTGSLVYMETPPKIKNIVYSQFAD